MSFKDQTSYWVDKKTGKPRYYFEEMYKDISDPWNCSKTLFSIENKIFLQTIFTPDIFFKSILDIGCGLGDLSNIIYQTNRLNSKSSFNLVAVDTSQTAVSKAKNNFPNICFKKFDLINDDFDESNTFDLITMSDVFWYLVKDLHAIIGKISKKIVLGGYIAIKQYFPKEQKYFKQDLCSPDDLIQKFKEYNYEVINNVWLHNSDGLIACIIFKKI